MAKLSDLRELERSARTGPREASPVTVAVVMAAVAGCFIAGIAAAFITTRDTGTVQQQAAAPLPPPAIYEKAPAETTGSGG